MFSLIGKLIDIFGKKKIKALEFKIYYKDIDKLADKLLSVF